VQRDDALARSERAAEAIAQLPPDDPIAQAAREAELSAAVDAATSELQKLEVEADKLRSALARAEAEATAAQAAVKREDDRHTRLVNDLKKAQSDLASLGDPAKIEAALQDARARHVDADKKAQAAQAALAAASRA